MNDLVKFSAFPRFHDSPFMKELTTVKHRNKTVRVSKEPVKFIDEDTGVISDTAMFLHIKEEVDKERFVKVFKGQLRFLFDLNKTALKVVGYLMEALPINKDTVLFDLKDCLAYTGFQNKKSVYDGLAELLRKEILAKSDKINVFFVNPSITFNGNRMVVVNEYKRKHDSRNVEEFNRIIK